MPRKKPSSGLPPEVLAVLRISTDHQLCPKFRRANFRQFAKHINDAKCKQCLKLLRQWDKEFRLKRFPRQNRN
jgi:DNA polymerase III delta subunit